MDSGPDRFIRDAVRDLIDSSVRKVQSLLFNNNASSGCTFEKVARHWVQSRTAPRTGPTRRHQWETEVCQRAQMRKIESGRKMEG